MGSDNCFVVRQSQDENSKTFVSHLYKPQRSGIKSIFFTVRIDTMCLKKKEKSRISTLFSNKLKCMLIWKLIRTFFEETNLETFLTMQNTCSKRVLSECLYFQNLVASLNTTYKEEMKPLCYQRQISIACHSFISCIVFIDIGIKSEQIIV